MRLVQLYVKCDKAGKPVWDSLQVKIGPERKAIRVLKFRNHLAPAARKRKAIALADKLTIRKRRKPSDEI
jgi:hypothetical protein